MTVLVGARWRVQPELGSSNTLAVDVAWHLDGGFTKSFTQKLSDRNPPQNGRS